MDVLSSPLVELLLGIIMVRDVSDVGVPIRQRWLRDACCSGDLR